jgi:hypothetical protein
MDMAKSGPRDVQNELKGAGGRNIVNNSGGSAGASRPQRPIAGPENPGPPISMRKALAKKNVGGGRGRNSPGLVQ